eukprot:TRINITY_DN8970_c0_g1_i1.p1 TRINITY_DN8970_c0_g1~~TRINITY_DN8970_c0_g1_i1.p1  ORF type:complete len:262 (+),score=72.19 TRINITY_DN8970_c0_g1_i1:55-840(+)
MSGNSIAYQLGIVREGDEIRTNVEDAVILHITHSVFESGVMEKRFDKHITISEMKWKIQTHFGTDSCLMILQLKDRNGQMLYDNMDDDKMLGYYSPMDGQIVHAVDLDPNAKQKVRSWTDVSLVEKYEISEEDYNKRENTVRAQKLARMEKLRAEGKLPEQKVADPEAFADEAANMKPEDRCIVFPGDRKGTVRYVGKIPELKAGYWVGVEFDEPVGKNDGSVKGKRYFECRPNYGGFTTPDKVTVGDYPEDDILAELDEL